MKAATSNIAWSKLFHKALKKDYYKLTHDNSLDNGSKKARELWTKGGDYECFFHISFHVWNQSPHSASIVTFKIPFFNTVYICYQYTTTTIVPGKMFLKWQIYIQSLFCTSNYCYLLCFLLLFPLLFLLSPLFLLKLSLLLLFLPSFFFFSPGTNEKIQDVATYCFTGYSISCNSVISNMMFMMYAITYTLAHCCQVITLSTVFFL